MSLFYGTGEWWKLGPVVGVPHDVDPRGRLKDDGLWQFREPTIPCENVDYGIYAVPLYRGDEERAAWEARVRRFYRRPRWLMEHGVSLAGLPVNYATGRVFAEVYVRSAVRISCKAAIVCCWPRCECDRLDPS